MIPIRHLLLDVSWTVLCTSVGALAGSGWRPAWWLRHQAARAEAADTDAETVTWLAGLAGREPLEGRVILAAAPHRETTAELIERAKATVM